MTPVNGLQLGRSAHRGPLRPGRGRGRPLALADDILMPLEVISSLGGGHRPAEGSTSAGGGSRSDRAAPRGRCLELRVCNPRQEPTTVSLGEHSGWLVDLRGRPIEAFDGSFELGPFRIATARLDEA